MDLPLPRSSSQHLTAFKSKILAIDRHIRHSQGLPKTIFMHPEMLEQPKADSQKYEIKNSLKLRERKAVILKDSGVAIFEFEYCSIPDNQRYCLHVTPQNMVAEVQVAFDGQRKKKYRIEKQQSVLLRDTNWQKLVVSLRALQTNSLSLAKIQLDTHKIQFQPRSGSAIPPQKKIVQRELEEYLKKNLNKEKILEITKKRRSQSQGRSQSLGRPLTIKEKSKLHDLGSWRPSTSEMGPVGATSLTSLRAKSIQMKRDYIQFEDSKEKYLKHFEKMNREKFEMIKSLKAKYDQEKWLNLRRLARLLLAVKFSHQVHQRGVAISRMKMKQMQANLLCKRFIRKMFQANKMRVSYLNRNKMAPDLTLRFMSCLLYRETVGKAQNRIVECLQEALLKEQLGQAIQKSEQFQEKVKRIQRFLRKKRSVYIERFSVLVEIVKGRVFENEEEKQRCFRQYMAVCKQKSSNLKYGFVVNHKSIDQILLKQRGDESHFDRYRSR